MTMDVNLVQLTKMVVKRRQAILRSKINSAIE